MREGKESHFRAREYKGKDQQEKDNDSQDSGCLRIDEQERREAIKVEQFR